MSSTHPEAPPMLIVTALCLAAVFAALVIGHLLALQAIFTSADHADCRREARVARTFLPDVPV